VAGSDGLLDNLDENQIAEFLISEFDSNLDLIDASETTSKLAQLAFEYSLNRNYMSPFAKKALDAGYHYVGGKSDDITVVISQVKLASYQRKYDL